MASKRRHEGYLLIDHRDSPGVPDALIHAARAAGKSVIAGGRGKFETPTITCSHCQRQLAVNRKRVRARGYCPKCDHYVCDFCERIRVKTGVCRQFVKVLDAALAQAANALAAEPLVQVYER